LKELRDKLAEKTTTRAPFEARQFSGQTTQIGNNHPPGMVLLRLRLELSKGLVDAEAEAAELQKMVTKQPSGSFVTPARRTETFAAITQEMDAIRSKAAEDDKVDFDLLAKRHHHGENKLVMMNHHITFVNWSERELIDTFRNWNLTLLMWESEQPDMLQRPLPHLPDFDEVVVEDREWRGGEAEGEAKEEKEEEDDKDFGGDKLAMLVSVMQELGDMERDLLDEVGPTRHEIFKDTMESFRGRLYCIIEADVEELSSFWAECASSLSEPLEGKRRDWHDRVMAFPPARRRDVFLAIEMEQRRLFAHADFMSF